MGSDSAVAVSTEVARVPLSRERVLHAAVDLADDGGLDALTMRGLARRLGVEAMSLYHHVPNKEAILDGVIEVVITEILAAVEQPGGPAPEDDWQAALRARILTARQVLLRHRWAPRVLETRTKTIPVLVRYYDGILGILKAGGFSYDVAHHALHALGSRALGFARELFEPENPEAAEEESAALLEEHADQFPHLLAMLAEVAHDEDGDTSLGWCDDQVEFEFGLDVILDGLESRRTTPGASQPPVTAEPGSTVTSG
jgi:AcrR family transcriptional regulator